MKFNPKALPITSKALFTIVGGAVLINPVFAQEQASEELEEVVVTGLRGSLKASMETKRDAIGVVDAINAEDIGKFPDTNLAESLQRITGISIDRRNGEGALVTARGFGPQFNMVTLNGRQMPAPTRSAAAARSPAASAATRVRSTSPTCRRKRSARSRSTRPAVPTSPPAASARRSTSGPRVRSTTTAWCSTSASRRSTTRRIASATTSLRKCRASSATPTTTRRCGVGLSASYQKRDSGSSSSTVNDWHIRPWDPTTYGHPGRVPLYVNDNDTPYNTADDVIDAIVNAPANGQLYGIPNDIRYAFSDSERERTNAQVAVAVRSDRRPDLHR